MSASEALAAVQVVISPHDPVIVRDGRSFSAGSEGANRARSLDWPHPSTTAGAVRTFLGRQAAVKAGRQAVSIFHDPAFIARLKEISIWGPLPQVGDDLYVPAPRDYIAYDVGKSAALRPERLSNGEGCNMPQPDLWPTHVACQEKPQKPAAFWSINDAAAWLCQDKAGGFTPAHQLAAIAKDERVHVRIDPASQTADDSQLFMTQGLVIPDVQHQRARGLSETALGMTTEAMRLALLVHVRDGELAALARAMHGLQPFGGERRLVHFGVENPGSAWQCPANLCQALTGATGVRMVLATPAIFAGGWLPGWLDAQTLVGSPPGTRGLRLRLRGACTGRWQALSGWSLEKGRRGPKPIRRLVPAGSVYFFEVVGGAAQELADLWLAPVSDGPQDSNDGFGLAMWGLWDARVAEGGSGN